MSEHDQGRADGNRDLRRVAIARFVPRAARPPAPRLALACTALAFIILWISA